MLQALAQAPPPANCPQTCGTRTDPLTPTHPVAQLESAVHPVGIPLMMEGTPNSCASLQFQSQPSGDVSAGSGTYCTLLNVTTFGFTATEFGSLGLSRQSR